MTNSFTGQSYIFSSAVLINYNLNLQLSTWYLPNEGTRGGTHRTPWELDISALPPSLAGASYAYSVQFNTRLLTICYVPSFVNSHSHTQKTYVKSPSLHLKRLLFGGGSGLTNNHNRLWQIVSFKCQGKYRWGSNKSFLGLTAGEAGSVGEKQKKEWN